MATVTWTQVQQWIQKNPHKGKTLSPYKPANISIEGPNETHDADGWAKISAAPATPLACILLAQDTLYHASPEGGRRSILRDETTDLQEKAVLHLKGRAWPVRRTAEGIAACGLEEGRASAWPELGWRALCTLRECQIIILNEDKKEISFYPEDIRTWSSSVDTFCVDHECRFVWTHARAAPMLAEWLVRRETDNWKISWPTYDGNMDELKAQAVKLGDTLPPKILKEVLQRRIGKIMSIQTLQQWVAQ